MSSASERRGTKNPGLACQTNTVHITPLVQNITARRTTSYPPVGSPSRAC